MQKVRIPQNSFQFGEVSDSLKMRTDTGVYTGSAQKVENMIITAEGSAKKRTGLKHIYDYSVNYDASYPNQSHLFPFIFDNNEQYIISIEHQKVRCFRIVDSTTTTLVATITSDINSATLPFDKVYLQQYTAAQMGDVMFICHPLFAPRLLTRTSLTDFEISTYTFDTRADNKQIYQPYSKYQAVGVTLDPAATSGSGVSVQVYSTGTADDDGVAQEQTYTSGSTPSNLTLNGALASSNTVTLSIPRDITFTSDTDNSGVTLTITGENANGIAAQENITGPAANATVSTSFFKFTKITAITVSGYYTNIKAGVGSKLYATYFDTTGTRTGGEFPDSTHKGVVLRYGGAEMDIVSVQSPNQITVDISEELKIRLSVANPLRSNDGSDKVEVTQLAHGYAGGESITISDASAVGGINASQINGARTVGTIIDDNTYEITAGAAANSSEDGGGFPKIATHAATVDWDEQAWSAKRGYPAAVAFHENRLVFAGTLAEPDSIFMSEVGEYFNHDVGTAQDNQAIKLTAATGDVHEIRYLISSRDLQVFAGTGELYVPTYLNQAITPTNAQIREQTPYGSSFVTPSLIDGSTVFVQASGRIVREYLFTDSEDAYASTAISTISSHLINSPKYMAVVHSGFNQPDSYAIMIMDDGDAAIFTSNRAEKRASWSEFTTNGKFDSVVSIDDRLFVNVYDANNKLKLCEFTGDIGLDSYIYGAISGNAVTVSSAYANSVTVDVIATDGSTLSYLGEFTVGSGSVDLSAYSTAGFTHAYVGKKFTSKIVSNPIDASGAAGPITGMLRGITNVVVDMKETRSIKVNSKPINLESNFTGKKEVRLLGYSRDPQVTIEQNDPLDMQVNGFISEVVI